MSTKIYYGHRFDGTWEELLEVCIQLRKDYIKEVEVLYTKFLDALLKSDEVCNREEMYFSAVKGVKYKDFNTGHQAYYLMGLMESGLSDPLNTDSSIIAYPFEGKIYIVPFMDHKWNKLTERSDKFKFFGYWNNTDPDEGCTEEEWNERERVWESIFPGYEPAKIYGLTYEIFGKSDVWSVIFNMESQRLKKEKQDEIS